MLTFDTIRDLERVERREKALQQLPKQFHEELQEYLLRKYKHAADAKEITHIKATIKRLFELREKKIADQALLHVQTGLSPKHVTGAEQELFSSLIEIFASYRSRLGSIIEQPEKPLPPVSMPKQTSATSPAPPIAQIAYRVKKLLPSFVGPDMQIYTLQPGDLVQLPKPLNDLLLNEGVLEQITLRETYEDTQKSAKILPDV